MLSKNIKTNVTNIYLPGINPKGILDFSLTSPILGFLRPIVFKILQYKVEDYLVPMVLPFLTVNCLKAFSKSLMNF